MATVEHISVQCKDLKTTPAFLPMAKARGFSRSLVDTLYAVAHYPPRFSHDDRPSLMRYRNQGINYRQNHGIPGVVYLLVNDGLRDGYVKIGCSRRSGEVRAKELNDAASTGTPGMFRCVFQCRTKDCGRAEEKVFEALAQERRGKWGQEFFEVPLERAKSTILQVCATLDREPRDREPRDRAPRVTPSVTVVPEERKSTQRRNRIRHRRLVKPLWYVFGACLLWFVYAKYVHTLHPTTSLPPKTTASSASQRVAVVNHHVQNLFVRSDPKGGKEANNQLGTLPQGAIVTVYGDEVFDPTHHVYFVRIQLTCKDHGTVSGWVSAKGLEAYSGSAHDTETPQRCGFEVR